MDGRKSSSKTSFAEKLEFEVEILPLRYEKGDRHFQQTFQAAFEDYCNPIDS